RSPSRRRARRTRRWPSTTSARSPRACRTPAPRSPGTTRSPACAGSTPPTRSATGSSSSASVGEQALAGELLAGLREREVRRGEDQRGLAEVVVAQRRAAGAHQLQQLAVGAGEGRLVRGLHGADRRVVELVELV